MNQLREIREARKLTQEELGKKIGTTGVSISRYEKHDHKLTLPVLRKLANELQSSVAQIAAEEPLDSPNLPSVYVPTYSAEASAGNGTIVDEEHITGFLAFKADWLRSVTIAEAGELGVITVHGDSMEPMLRDEDHVLVDCTQSRPRRDGIYVVRYEDAVQVKRLSLHPITNLLTIRSDNPEYPTFADLRGEQLDIVGRVIWLGRRV